MALRLDTLDFLDTPKTLDVLYFVVPSTIFVFIRLGLYRAVLRFISSRMLKIIMFCSFASASIMFLADQILTLPVPRSVPIIYMFLLFCAIGGSRFLWRTIYRMLTTKQREKVVIYGAGEAGRQLMEALRYLGEYSVAAFIDDDKMLHGQEIGSITVYPPNRLAELKEDHNVNAVLIAVPNASRAQRKRIITSVEKYTLQLRTIPTIDDLISGRAKISDLKVVEVGELLGREIVPPHNELLKKNIFGKVVLITGGGGSIGSELCRQSIEQRPDLLLILDVSEYALYKIHQELEKNSDGTKIVPILGSVQNKDLLNNIFSSYSIDTVYHAAAYKHVPLVEQNIAQAILNNVFGTQKLVESAVKAGVTSFTLISTDKAVRPTNYMGASKRLSELICKAYSKNQFETRISMVRFGNVLASSGSVIPRFTKQIEAGGPITVTHPDITRFFMTITEAAQLVMQASGMADGGEVFVLDMGNPIKISELAQKMVRLHGLVPYFENSSAEDVENGDICIQYTGLRPGEKLYEELLIGLKHSETAHVRIMSADETYMELPELLYNLEKIYLACEVFDVEKLKHLLVNMPLCFTPDNV